MATNGDQESNEQPQPQLQGDQPAGGGFTISGKMLGIVGGGIGAVVLVVVIVVVLLVTGVFGGGGGGASGGRDLLAYIPGDAGIVAIGDNRAVLNGNVPEDLIEYWEDNESGGGLDDFPDYYDDLDIDDDDVATFALVADEDQNDSLAIVQGDFEFDVIREDLEDGLDCEDDDYRGFELWECPDGGAVALFEKDGYLVFAAERRQGDLEDLLTDKSRDPDELADADDSEIKEILSRTDGGWLQVAVITDDCVIERCQGLAIAVGESDDSDSIPASYAVMFSSERAATAAEGDVAIDDLIGEMFASFDLELDIGEVKAAGDFVVGSGTAEFVDPDNPRSRSSVPSDGSGSSRASEREGAPAATQVSRGQAAAPAPQARTAPTNTPRPEPTATPVPQLKPESVLSLIPEATDRILWVHWQHTSAGSYLPEDRSDIAGQIFRTMDFFRIDLDVSNDSVSEIALVQDLGMTVLKGNFDLASVKAKLDDGNAEQVNYRGYELWQGNRGTFALFDEYIVHSGNRNLIQQTLQSLYRGSGSLADASENNDMVRVLGRVGDGVIVRAVVRRCGFEHCLGYGWAITDIDANSDIGVVNIEFLFRNDRAATDAAAEYDSILNFLMNTYGINIQDTVADGSFVVGAAIWEF